MLKLFIYLPDILLLYIGQETDSISSDDELSTTLTTKANISSKRPSNVHQLEQVAEQINMCIQSMNRHPVAQGGFTFADSVTMNTLLRTTFCIISCKRGWNTLTNLVTMTAT